jgi:hypothetical protein
VRVSIRPAIVRAGPSASASWRLALEAHLANEAWNAAVPTWNRHPSRRARARRSKPGAAMAAIAIEAVARAADRPFPEN